MNKVVYYYYSKQHFFEPDYRFVRSSKNCAKFGPLIVNVDRKCLKTKKIFA